MPLSSHCIRTNSYAHSPLGVFMFVVCWYKTVCFFYFFREYSFGGFTGETAAHSSMKMFVFAKINKLLKVTEKGALTPHTAEW